MQSLPVGQSIQTEQGASLRVMGSGGQQTIQAPGSTARVVRGPVMAGKSVIYYVDNVLLPEPPQQVMRNIGPLAAQGGQMQGGQQQQQGGQQQQGQQQYGQQQYGQQQQGQQSFPNVYEARSSLLSIAASRGVGGAATCADV